MMRAALAESKGSRKKYVLRRERKTLGVRGSPPVGAWIETATPVADVQEGARRPPVGAWIETSRSRRYRARTGRRVD